ncbi:MAG: glycosyltransferase family 2 protein [Anaerolineae bacterium]
MTLVEPILKNKQIDQNFSAAIQIEIGLAHAWLRKGRLVQAIQRFQKALALDPTLEAPYIDLAQIFIHLRRWEDVISTCEIGLDHFPNQAKLHKHHIKALLEKAGWNAACSTYGLSRIDYKGIELNTEDMLCLLVVRNEVLRLPWFLTYYRQLGIKHFLVVDNGSDDGSLELLLEQPDVYLWQSDMSFNAANFGSAWFELLLQKYGVGRWCLTLDADELVTFAGAEQQSLPELCAELDLQGKRAASGIMLDMVSDKPLSETVVRPGQNFLDVCYYFDRRFYHDLYDKASPFKNQDFHFGGLRKRVFGTDVEYLVTKTPLLKYQADTVLAGGQHWTSFPYEQIAHQQVCVLHFKYFSSFIDYAQQESQRGEHSGGGEQYKSYAAGFDENRDLVLYDAAESVKYSGSQQLIDLGIMLDGLRPSQPEFPQIKLLDHVYDRPFWSVMITVYDRLQFVGRVINSVLSAASSYPADEMQIVLVNDGMDGSARSKAFQAELTSLVKRIAGDRIVVKCLPNNLGHPHIFNHCIELAHGEWVHILHDDDIVGPNFYKALQDGIEQRPDVGAAFARHNLMNGQRQVTWTSWAERETPGVISHWLERIAIECRLQFSAMVVARSTYEQLGGFYNQVGSAFDWEMWKRIAASYPVWFDPSILSTTVRDGTAETDQLMIDGQQIADSLKTIAVSKTYLPADKAEFLSQKAHERFALYGLDLASKQLRAGDTAAALLNIRESLKANHSDPVLFELLEILAK